MAHNNIGADRLVVGAGYGTRGWLIQRITAVIMAVFTIIVLVQFLRARDFSYDAWGGVFSPMWMKIATFVTVVALVYHAWVGVRDIAMDYIKPVGIRLAVHVFTTVWLVGCVGYALHILWRI